MRKSEHSLLPMLFVDRAFLPVCNSNFHPHAYIVYNVALLHLVYLQRGGVYHCGQKDVTATPHIATISYSENDYY